MSKGGAQSKRKNGSEVGAGKKQKNPMWILPVIRSGDLGKVGPGFGFGVGCGVGVGVGLFGGAGLGTGFPGLQIGIGAGAGCGVGLGFGYAVGKGIARDENGKYSNVGKLFDGQDIPYRNEIDSIVDGIVVNTKKIIAATSKQIEKWS